MCDRLTLVECKSAKLNKPPTEELAKKEPLIGCLQAKRKALVGLPATRKPNGTRAMSTDHEFVLASRDWRGSMRSPLSRNSEASNPMLSANQNWLRTATLQVSARNHAEQGLPRSNCTVHAAEADNAPILGEVLFFTSEREETPRLEREETEEEEEERTEAEKGGRRFPPPRTPRRREAPLNVPLAQKPPPHKRKLREGQ